MHGSVLTTTLSTVLSTTSWPEQPWGLLPWVPLGPLTMSRFFNYNILRGFCLGRLLGELKVPLPLELPVEVSAERADGVVESSGQEVLLVEHALDVLQLGLRLGVAVLAILGAQVDGGGVGRSG